MAQYSVAVNNARLDAVEATVGASAKLRFYTGAAPANCAAAATGTLIAELSLPADWMAAASGATKLKSGTWTGTSLAAGEIGHYRIADSAGTAVGVQGPAGETGTEMILDNSTVEVGQTILVNSYTINAANI